MSKPVLLSIGNGKVQELVGTANNDVLTWDSTLDGGSWKAAAGGGGGGSGTVTSVGLQDGTSGMQVSVGFGESNPITDAGTFYLDAPLRFAFDTVTPTAVAAAGQVAWNDTEGSLESMLKGDNVVASLGQQIYQRVVNAEASPITKGQIVYVFGSSGTRVSVKLALADADLTSAGILGVVAETIAASGTGFVMTSGLMKNLSVLPATTFADGEVVYLSATTAGALTNVKPTAPNHLVTVGYVAKASNGSSGELLVHPQNGYELGELHDVYVNSPTSGQILIYDATVGQTRWENASLTGGTGVTVTPGPGSLSVSIGQAVGTTASVQFGSMALTTALPVTSGGTGLSSITTGQILYASGTNTLAAGTLSNLNWTAVSPLSDMYLQPVGSLFLQPAGNISLQTSNTLGAQGSIINIGTDAGSSINIGHASRTTTVLGTLAAATAAVDTNTTQVATTAYVVGQGYLKSATAASTYAPLASPTFTGTVTLPLTTAGYVTTTSGGVISSSATIPTSDLSGSISLTTQVTGTLPVGNGGTGLSSIASGQILYASGTNTLAAGTLSSLNWSAINPVSNIDIAPFFVTSGNGRITNISGGYTNNGTGGAITLRGGNVLVGTGGATNLTGGSGTVANGAVNIGATTTSAVNIGATGITTTVNGTLSLANDLALSEGGTGASLSASAGAVAYSTASALALTAVGTSGQFLKSNGASAPAFASIAVADVSGAAPLASPTFTGTVTLPLTTAGYVTTTSGGVISSSATVPTSDLSGSIALGSQVSGTLPVANGGTGAATTQANKVFAGPTTGADAAPSFRALVAADVAGLTPYDLSGEFVGTPVASATIMRFIAVRPFTLTDAIAAYFACTSNTGATAAVFTVNVAGVSKGTVSIAGNATSGTGTLTSTSVTAGQTVDVVATTPANIVNVWFTLPGTV